MTELPEACVYTGEGGGRDTINSQFSRVGLFEEALSP